MSSPYGRRPPYRRRGRLGFMATAWLMIFGAILGIAVVAAAHAHATVGRVPINICAELRAHTSLAVIERQLVTDGFSPRAAGIYAGTAVRAQCPELIGWVMGELV